MPVLLVFVPLAIISESICMDVSSISVSPIVHEITLVHVAVWMKVSTLSMRLAVAPGSDILASIAPRLSPFSILKINFLSVLEVGHNALARVDGRPIFELTVRYLDSVAVT